MLIMCMLDIKLNPFPEVRLLPAHRTGRNEENWTVICRVVEDKWQQAVNQRWSKLVNQLA